MCFHTDDDIDPIRFSIEARMPGGEIEPIEVDIRPSQYTSGVIGDEDVVPVVSLLNRHEKYAGGPPVQWVLRAGAPVDDAVAFAEAFVARYTQPLTTPKEKLAVLFGETPEWHYTLSAEHGATPIGATSGAKPDAATEPNPWAA